MTVTDDIKAFVKDQPFLIQPNNSGYGSTGSSYGIDCKNGKYGIFQFNSSDIDEFNQRTEYTKGYWKRFKE
jgi:hypothetical protein